MAAMVIVSLTNAKENNRSSQILLSLSEDSDQRPPHLHCVDLRGLPGVKRQKFFWELQATRRASNKEAMIPSFRKRIPSLGTVLKEIKTIDLDPWGPQHHNRHLNLPFLLHGEGSWDTNSFAVCQTLSNEAHFVVNRHLLYKLSLASSTLQTG